MPLSWIVLFVNEELILICYKIINEQESSLKYCSSTIAFCLSILNRFMVHDLNVFQVVFNHKQVWELKKQALILHNEIHLSVWPGLDSIFPISSIKWSVKSENNAITFGFRPWSKRRQTKKVRALDVSSKYVQISISLNNKRSTQSARVRMEHAYSCSVFFQTITHWALGLKTTKSRDRPVPLLHQNTHRSILTQN
jgi:hypothetical protein